MLLSIMNVERKQLSLVVSTGGVVQSNRKVFSLAGGVGVMLTGDRNTALHYSVIFSQ